MERKNWLVYFLIMLFSVALLIIVMMANSVVTSAAPTTKENPYEYWVDGPANLNKCSVKVMYQAFYNVTISNVGDDSNFRYNFSGIDALFLNFDKGSWNATTHTFRAENKIEENKINKTDYFLSQGCEIVFDPGMNEIESFKLHGYESIINHEDYNSSKDFRHVNVCGLKLLRREAYETVKKDNVVIFGLAKNKTLFGLYGKGMSDSVKIKARFTRADKSGIKVLSLTKYNYDNNSHLEIIFDGYLPKLPAHEGKCSWFGGPYDTGVDIPLRKTFYEKHIGKYATAGFTYEEFYKDKTVRKEFNKWMNKPTQRLSWEGTGLACGPARELDTENDDFCAMRWQQPYANKGIGHQKWWREQKIKVTNIETEKSTIVRPVDWGPHKDTGRVIDLSNKSRNDIGAETNDWLKICWADRNAPLGPCQ